MYFMITFLYLRISWGQEEHLGSLGPLPTIQEKLALSFVHEALDFFPNKWYGIHRHKFSYLCLCHILFKVASFRKPFRFANSPVKRQYLLFYYPMVLPSVINQSKFHNPFPWPVDIILDSIATLYFR